MLRKLRAWRALPPAERAGLGRAARLLPAVRLSLQLLGLRRTQAWLARRPAPPPPNPTEESGRVETTVRLVLLAARHQRPCDNCLARSLTLWALLRRQGIAAEVRVGTRPAAGRLEAHAWVEWRGRALTDPGDGGGAFAAFDRPLAGRAP